MKHVYTLTDDVECDIGERNDIISNFHLKLNVFVEGSGRGE
jgi:hypothetical protein